MQEPAGRSEDEEVVPEQPDWFRAALSSMSDAVVLVDAGGRVTFINPAAEALTGWPRADALGQPLPLVIRAVDEQTRRPAGDAAAAFAGGAAVLVARDGTERPIEGRSFPVGEGPGGPAGAVLVFRPAGGPRRPEDGRGYAEGIVETFPQSLLVLDADLQVRFANRAFYRAFGVSPAETEGRSLCELGNRQWDTPRLRELLAQVLPHNRPFGGFEVEHEFPAVGRRTMRLSASRLDRPGGGPGLILLGMEDVTESRRAAHALEVSETRYRRLFETAQDGILILDADRKQILDANPFLTDLLGYRHDELVGRELWEIGLFKDIESSKAAFRELQEAGYIRYDDLPLRTKDGRPIEVEFVSNVYLVDSQKIIQCNIRDVTARRRAEDALREAYGELGRRVEERTAELARANEALKAEIQGHKQAEAARVELLRQLVTAQEEERHRIARELHDQMGQHLAALILGLQVLKDATPEGSPARERLQNLQQLSDRIGKEVHHLALELRPTALDDLGLHTTLVNYVEEWSERSGVDVDFHSTGLDSERLPPAVETTLYRIVQEALTNVLKHAGARRLSLILQRSANQVLAIVEDDGCGFDPDGDLNRPGAKRRLGLLGMRERVALAGGTLLVESTPGKGTTLFIRIPLAAD